MIFNMNGVNYDTNTMRTDEEINALINANPEIALVSYAGTGHSGSSYPNSVTFPFAPRVVIMIGYGSTGSIPGVNLFSNNSNQLILIAELLTTSYAHSTGFEIGNTYGIYGKKSADGKTLYWYIDTTYDGGNWVGWQCNSSGCTYYLLGFK